MDLTGEIKILIVEDNVIVAQDIRSRVEQFNYTVTNCVTSGETAIQSCLDEPPDLILMDIKLKGELNGIEAYSQIRKTSRIPVIYLTSYSDEATLAAARITGPSGYIVKPFEDEDLKTTIFIALHQFELAEELRESRQQYSGVVDTIQDSLVVVNQTGMIKFVNKAFTKMYQYTSAEATDMLASELIHPEYHSTFNRFLQELKQKGQFSGTTVDIRKDGTTFHTDVRGSRIQFDSESCFLAVVRDVTDSIMAQKVLRQERDRLAKALAEVKKLSGLLPICGHCKKIRDDKGYWNQIEEYIQDHTAVTFSHGVCQDCMKEHYPDID